MLSGLERQKSKVGAAGTQGRPGREWAINVLLIVLAAAVLLAGTCLLLYGSDLILPGVEALGVPLGGRLKSRAVAALEEAWQSRTLILRAGDKTWTIVASSLGLELDARAVADLAHRQSRSLNSLRAWLKGKGRLSVSPVVRVDREAAEAGLQRLASELALAPVDAIVRVVGSRVEAVPAAPGRELDVAATAAWLEQSAHQVAALGVLDLRTKAVSPAVTDVSGLVQRANDWLAHSLSLHLWDPISDEAVTWVVEPETWAGWMTLQVDAGSASGLGWTLDAARVRAFLEARMGELESGQYLLLDQAGAAIEQAIADQSWAARLRVCHRARQHTVGFGETIASIARDCGIPYPWILQANPGVSNALRPGQVIAIPSPDVLLPLPIVEGKRIIVNLGQQWMWAYEGNALLWQWPVSTGIPSSPTSPGVFQIQSHELNAYAASWDLWMPYFMGIYRPVPTANFMNGFHGFPTRDGATLLWTGNLGTPVTFGCILLSTSNATLLYEWAEEGVIVEIRP